MTFKRWQGPNRPVSNGATVIKLRLEANADAPGLAREAIARAAGRTSPDVLERAALLISEVVTNSVVHAGGTDLRVDIWSAGGSLAVVVTDDGAGFIPTAGPGTIADSDGGFGLPLLDTLSEAWGSGSGEGSWVWFEVSPRIIARPPAEVPDPPEHHQDLLDIRMVVDSVQGHALIALDLTGHVTNWGAAATRLTGWSAEEMLGRALFELYDHPSTQAFSSDLGLAASDGWQHGERTITRRDGSQLFGEVALSPIVDRSGGHRGFSALISDAGERKGAEDAHARQVAELRDLAMTDDLTGLPNRRRWSEELGRDLARTRRHNTPLVIAMLDLNRFKAFNDANGHLAGDALLREVAQRWSSAVRTTDLLARYGGDEFVITLPECSPAVALTVLERVQRATPERIGSCAGLAASEGSETAKGLVARADAALFEAKRTHQQVVMAPTAESSRR